jgi:hypothetical protein
VAVRRERGLAGQHPRDDIEDVRPVLAPLTEVGRGLGKGAPGVRLSLRYDFVIG